MRRSRPAKSTDVIPANAGIHLRAAGKGFSQKMDSRVRGNDMVDLT
jgi:hypothetical protein